MSPYDWFLVGLIGFGCFVAGLNIGARTGKGRRK